ncbi:ABC transporter ATP-binding protein [Streptomyces albireticuli]|uniref:ABC transporter n=1 Tax=Streptomyces albireticuli TaxID=1940 RepID=A0A2A2CWK8_9ACTN|nr:ATP-binding cassette domain-containing protein [Streptomyces albireticuli]MCD9140620.1 ATP-binding cassette domain-containing protein [Streptomyces albireticuli]MCD9161418.1 ATP-binding cassette domain-containing protein [Streptomyces albireticuli]MCD9193012.1 ATP-binding cassette domain-containing protein [Streptomyces albireticuli]PAU44598.1 ABC transporter [Streptomyces albireticuli]
MRLRGVGRRYGLRGPWVLRDVDLDLPRGALLRVEGANGSGKSTLLRLLAGIDTPTAGRITGRPRTAYVPERFPAALPFTAAGYLTHLGRVHGLGRAAAARGAEEWLERFGAGRHARTSLSELSKGTSQKVAVAQALLADPELLVLDEAWTGLDRDSRTLLDDAVTGRVAAGGTVVFVDHDPRRLAASLRGAADAVHRVAGGRLTTERAVDAAGASTGAGPGGPADAGSRGLAEADPRDPRVLAEFAGPRVLIEAQGPAGAPLPEGLPGAPALVPADSPVPPGTVRLTVVAAHSDALLRALLTARPAWHVHAVRPVDPPPASSAGSPSPTTESPPA